MPDPRTIRPVTARQVAPYFDHLAQIGNVGARPEEGFLRYSWSDEESAACEYIRQEAEKVGLEARYDAVGNLYASLPGAWPEIVLTGSHLDSVPKGGNYDGVAGVVTGLEAIKAIQASGVALRKGLALVVWRGEEAGTFGQPYKGCKAAFGQLPVDFLHNRLGEHVPHPNNRMTLEEAIRSQSHPMTGTPFDPSLIKNGIPALSQAERDHIAGFIELHIEQAKKLETDGDDIGIVTSIRAPARPLVTLEHPDYHDGYLARLIVTLSHQANAAIEQGLDLVQTFSLVNLTHAPLDSELRNCGKTKVPGYAEVRLNRPYQPLQELIETMAHEFNVAIVPERTAEGCLLKIRGSFDHSGATPMGRAYRRDVNLAAAYLVAHASDADPALRAVINYPAPTRATFLMDIRSRNTAGRDQYVAEVLDTIAAFKQEHDLSGEPPTTEYMPPAEHLDRTIQQATEAACQALGYRYQYLASGAGHDAAVVAKQTHSDGSPIAVGMIFIPCRKGKSHSPEEFTTLDAISKGANVLAQVLYQLAG
ncbi:M20/M25/M40 family metallo-hydrolase [candidate division KSB3 bacterium]|uniref:M20/M25/M40 family metallo-hydrolase n=1 Tax=candidate division KSB3 bacterium TaxID=2044937 RepID=A0A9D5Q6T2_9BACT|nr:M20/M25/M40 family metallo-hydrolase [candidate division KSB3 bacterium]MBD3325693.1 M20/M25/M40 family metallo-hydrolase [candidate division KSB3 bacterium]